VKAKQTLGKKVEIGHSREKPTVADGRYKQAV